VSARLAEQLENVIVIDRIEGLPAFSPHAHEAHGAEKTKLVRDGRLADPDFRCEFVDAKLAVAERVEDLHARGITKDAERVGDGSNVVCGQHLNI
jgi:hypothetical protein